MKENNLPFGEYVKQRREQLGKTMRGFAAEVEISPAYLCDIENGNRKAPERFLEKFVSALAITEPEEINGFYDLARVRRNVEPQRLLHFAVGGEEA